MIWWGTEYAENSASSGQKRKTSTDSVMYIARNETHEPPSTTHHRAPDPINCRQSSTLDRRIGKAQGTPAANNMHLPRVAKWGERETGQSRAAGEELPIRNFCTRGGRGQQRRIVKSLEIRCANTTRQQLPQHAIWRMVGQSNRGE